MKVRNNSLALVLATFAMTAAPAFAQSPREGGSPAGGGDSRAGGGGAGNSGNASSGGGGGGGSVATGGGGGTTSSSSGGGSSSFSSPSGFGATSPNISFGDRGGRRESAPSRRAEFAGWASSASSAAANSDGQARPRSAAGSGGSGGGSGDRAVPRGTTAEGRDRSPAGETSGARTRMTAPPREGSTGATNPNNTSGAREVPNWSRPRGDNPVTGTAVPRVGPPPDREAYYNRYEQGRYYGYGYPYYGYGNPYYSYYYPYYSFGVGYGLYSGWGWNPYYGDPWDPYYSGYAGSGGYSSGVYNTVAQGNLKLKVKPRNAKVYVDGFYVGLVDEFDGAFQKLALNSGRHKVEVRAEGFETAEFDVLITPDQTVTFQGELKRIQ